MKYIVAYMLLEVAVSIVIFCIYEWNEMRKCAKQYAEAKTRFDAMIWKEAKDCMKRLEKKDGDGV